MGAHRGKRHEQGFSVAERTVLEHHIERARTARRSRGTTAAECCQRGGSNEKTCDPHKSLYDQVLQGTRQARRYGRVSKVEEGRRWNPSRLAFGEPAR